ncbi:hypothetical protein ACQP2U_43420 (plasmid) [Nocardia sp. CA-084685]|uniref:hypothetical protein n=1 Tax=Nocardia sp. CA-084685 TaxID=3239970 RepID=UPI003D989642
MATTEKDGVHLRITADPRTLGRIFATMPWPTIPPEKVGEDVLEAKTIPAVEELLAHLDSLHLNLHSGPPPTAQS